LIEPPPQLVRVFSSHTNESSEHIELSETIPSFTLTLTGQSMLQYDIRQYEHGKYVIQQLKQCLNADVNFTELETAIYRDPNHMIQTLSDTVGQGARLRNSVFFHCAKRKQMKQQKTNCYLLCFFNLFICFVSF
jgi:hypothetical protein